MHIYLCIISIRILLLYNIRQIKTELKKGWDKNKYKYMAKVFLPYPKIRQIF